MGGFTFGQVDQGDRVGSLLEGTGERIVLPPAWMNAAVGRTLLPEDDVSPGAHFVVMLGFGHWPAGIRR